MSIVLGKFNIKAIFFDFDGVFTDNRVWTLSNGDELIVCSKKDSLGLDNFRLFLREKHITLEMAIISRESNSVVLSRSNKLKLDCHLGVINKFSFINKHYRIEKEEYIFFGNDMNDVEAMKNAAISLAPQDADISALEVASFIGQRDGGDGFIREGLEYVTNLLKGIRTK